MGEQFQEMQSHEEALLRLQFFEKQDFRLAATNVNKAYMKIRQEIGADNLWRMETINGQNGIVWVTARKDRMGEIGAIIETFHGATNQMQ